MITSSEAGVNGVSGTVNVITGSGEAGGSSGALFVGSGKSSDGIGGSVNITCWCR